MADFAFVDIAVDGDKRIINDKFDFLLQEIEILFDTSKGEVLGEDNFGTEFEDFIWDLNVSNTYISNYVKNKINNYTISGKFFNIDVNTKILRGTESDIILVEIGIKDPESNKSTNLIYKF